MSRIETIGDATLYLGDCREILPTLTGIEALVSDPPYGIAHVKGRGGRGKHDRRNIAPIAGDEGPFDPTALLGFPDVILWGASHYAQRLPHGRWLVWDKLAGLASYDSFSDIEIAWHNQRGAERIFRHMWKGICQDSEKDAKREHPTQKPIALMSWCIDQVRGRLICDPYMGTGTTGVAAIKAGRKFIGIEIEPCYFDVACRRIAETARQPDMFLSTPAIQAELEYDSAKDVEGSFNDAYAAVRERVAKGGPGWEPK